MESEGTGNGALPGLGAIESTGQAVDPGAGDDGGTGGGMLSDGMSGGNSSDPSTTSDSDSAGTDSGVVSGGDTGDPTGDSRGESDSGVGDTTGDSNDGEEGPDSAHVGPDGWDGCNEHVWCTDFFGDPTGPFFIQKCFDSPVHPPYELDMVQFHADVVWSGLDPVQVQVRERDADGSPGPTIWYGSLSGDSIDEGGNGFAFTPNNPVLSTSGFCVGFYIDDDPFINAGLGVGVHSGGVPEDSWYGGCGAGSFQDLVADAGYTANWCIAADIVASDDI